MKTYEEVLAQQIMGFFVILNVGIFALALDLLISNM